jgi:hypothetical protein
MPTLETRLERLERNAAQNKSREPMQYFILPEKDDPTRPAIDAKIVACNKAGIPTTLVVYEIV